MAEGLERWNTVSFLEVDTCTKKGERIKRKSYSSPKYGETWTVSVEVTNTACASSQFSQEQHRIKPVKKSSMEKGRAAKDPSLVERLLALMGAGGGRGSFL